MTWFCQARGTDFRAGDAGSKSTGEPQSCAQLSGQLLRGVRAAKGPGQPSQPADRSACEYATAPLVGRLARLDDLVDEPATAGKVLAIA